MKFIFKRSRVRSPSAPSNFIWKKALALSTFFIFCREIPQRKRNTIGFGSNNRSYSSPEFSVIIAA